MKIVRTIVWVLLLVALLIFSYNNWQTVDVKIWENLIVETKIPALVVVAFLIGLVPTWLVYRTSRWNYDRRIASLENSARSAALAAPPPPPVVEPRVEPVPPVTPAPDRLTPTDPAA